MKKKIIIDEEIISWKIEMKKNLKTTILLKIWK